MENRICVIGYLIFALSLGACGGSGGGGDTSGAVTPAQTAPTNSASTLRKMQVGDTWTYTTTGDFTGDMVVAITKTIVNRKGVTCFVEEMSGTLLHAQTAVSIMVREQGYTWQSPTGSRYHCGRLENGVPNFVESADGMSLGVQSPMRVGQLHSGVVTYTDGSWVDSTTQIQGFDSVPTFAGVFDSFRVRTTSSYSDGDISVATEWVVPSIGLVKRDVEIDGESSKILKFGLTLKSFQLK